MNQLKFIFLLFFSLVLTGCGELLYCRNPSSVAFVDHLPCTNCVFKGMVSPDFCPNGTYPYKLQCAAEGRGANVVLLNQHTNAASPRFSVYTCPPVGIAETPRNDKTDVSHSCSC